MFAWSRKCIWTVPLCLAVGGVALAAVGLAVQAADEPPTAAAAATAPAPAPTMDGESTVASESATVNWPAAMQMLAAALVICFTAFATALTQCRIGTAGVGVLAENPKLFGSVLVLLVVPETMVILGFVVAALMLF